MVPKARRSTSPVMLSSLSKVICKAIKNLSLFLCYCLIIKVSKLRCTPRLWPVYFSQTILKSFHIFFLFCCRLKFFSLCLSPLKLHFPGVHAVDSVEYQSVLSCLIQCPAEAFSPLHYFFPLTEPSPFCQYRRTNPGVSRVDLPKTLKAVASVVAFKEFQFSSTTSDC